jgi:hypothetical protein
LTTTDRPLPLPQPRPVAMRELRCACGALLAKAALAPGSTVEFVCRKCKRPIRVVVLN